MSFRRPSSSDSISGRVLSAVPILLFLCIILQAAQPIQKPIEFFESKIRPLLAENCYQCHSEQAKTLFANLHLDSRAGMLKGGDRGPVIVPGNPQASRLIQAVRQENLEMPPMGKLPDAQIEALVKWVEMGAPWPDQVAEAVPITQPEADAAAGLDHWAWQPVRKVSPPAVQNEDWSSHPIDDFILARLEGSGLSPSADADRYTLLRRVYIDLTGLPPPPVEIKAFIKDDSQDAFEKVVDRLLQSPRFGERWGRHWLDLTGYADNIGKGRLVPAKEAWRYRDYVINAFNNDKPYDRFVQEQVAGDVLEWENDAQRREQIIATGFLAIGPWALVDANKEQLRMDVVDNQIDTLGRTFLGLTLGCARCHDHKFDPIPTREYYALAGIFRSTKTLAGRESGIWSKINRVPLPETAAELTKRAAAMEQYEKALAEALIPQETIHNEKKQLLDRQQALEEREADSAEKEKIAEEIEEIDKKLQEATHRVQMLEFNRPDPPMAIVTEDRDVPEDCHINIQGSPHSLGEVVPRGFLSIASTEPPPRFAERRDLKGRYVRSSGRLELAAWLVNPENPLTARVMVNRIWHHLFGAGLVRTVDNFGTSGEMPSHPELLDYLASRFVEQGWSIKSAMREIVLTQTYRQASLHNVGAREIDPDNRLLWRINRRRLEAEAYRDFLLAISGRLDLARGGPSLPLDDPDNIKFDRPTLLVEDAKLDEATLRRRTVYLPMFRKSQLEPLEVLDLFDFPTPDETTGARSVTTVPTQSLYLMNSPFVQEQARVTAQALLERKELDDQERIAHLILKALNRPVTQREQVRALQFVADFEEELLLLPEAPENPQLEAWARYCHAVFLSNEFLFRG